jgi:uncharacterized repeat protein (TIGR01451 family)
MKKIVYVLIMLAALLTVVAQAAQITLTEFSTTFNNPIGIDYHEPNGGNLILSANYPNGQPTNLNLIQIPSGAVANFSNLAGLTDELKIATVRNSAACQQFPIGDTFTGNGIAGEIVRVDAAGNVYPPAANNPGSLANRSWVALPGSVANVDLLRGSLYVDRFCGFGGDLIVVTGNDFATGGGKVWRVKSNGTAQLVASVTDSGTGVHLEGLITLPNDPRYGPWAGTIIAGDENQNTNPSVDGRIWSITAAGVATSYNLSYDANGVHHPVKPEDLDLIEPGGDFYGVNYAEKRVLTAPASAFANNVGDILLTQEYPCGSTAANGDCAGNGSVHRSGLYALRYVGSGGNAAGGKFRVEEFTFNGGETTINQWEHVTLAPRGDVKVTKTTTTPTINSGQTASFDILVEALGPADSFGVMLTDTLPGTGWILSGTNAAACQPFDGQHLSCNFGTIPNGQSRTVTLSRVTTTNDCGRLDNTAVVTSINDRDSVNNTSSTSIIVNCAPPTVGLGDYVWKDDNGNGIQDANEVGVNGVTVNLYQCSAPAVIMATTVTANNPASPNPSKDGYYSFTNLAPGCYFVEFVNPGGFIFTIPGAGGNPALDSNANQTTGRTGNVNLVSGFDATIDAGLIPGIDLCPPTGVSLPGDGKAGKLYVWQDANFVYARLDQSTNLNDNSYGTNVVQWPGTHTFSNLVGSDKAQFIYKDASGNVALDIYLDYITAKSGTPSGYASLGVSGGEGRVNVGQAAWVVDWNTSLAQDLNDLGFCTGGNCSGGGTNLLVNSPPTVSHDSYTLPAGSPYKGWNFTNSYYAKVSKTAFGANTFGGVSIGLIHNSPAKTGSNAISPVPCVPGGGQPCTPQPVSGSIKSDFNGTSINSGSTIWFNSNLKVSGLSTTSPTVITFTNGKILFNGTSFDVPDGTITFDPSANCGKTEYKADGWQTKMPVGGSDEVFISGLALPVAASLPGGIKGVTWSGDFSADQPGVSISWKWSAAVYTQFPAGNPTTDPETYYNALGVKPAHTATCDYNNSDHAGTPELWKSFVVGGARGGGGSNFTGSWSATQSLTLICNGGPNGECNVTEGAVEIKDRTLKWTLSNEGTTAATLTKMTLTWPQANGMLKKVKFDADVIWDDGAAWSNAGITLNSGNFTTDPKKKRIDPGKSRNFILEFEKNAADSPYQLTLNFDTGCELTLDLTTGPPVQQAQCSDLKPIEQVVLDYAGANPLSSVSWFRTTVADINNPGTANLIGTASGATVMSGPFSFGNFAAASSTNDVDFVLTFTSGAKQRSRFHLSCSDPDMNDITDCGKPQGDGKDNSVTGGNLWTLRDLQGKGLQMCNYP